MENWPETFLPLPTVTFNGSDTGTSLRTPMDGGRVRQRARFSNRTRLASAQWQLDGDQFVIFEAWVRYRINQGADDFVLPLQMGATVIGYVARIVSGQYNFALQNKRWMVTAQIEVENFTGEMDAQTLTATIG